MKRRGILNADLSGALARLGHMDIVLLADCGMPIPRGVPVIDLALIHGIPRFEQVLDALLEEIVLQRCIAADEAKTEPAGEWLAKRFPEIDYISHDSLKALSTKAKLFLTDCPHPALPKPYRILKQLLAILYGRIILVAPKFCPTGIPSARWRAIGIN